ncbi:MAG: hypothetical protein HOL70_16655 [Candidatus Marinimicrobia bacterium]|jgi:hypothetical protein|nr:hypothetical protein [Candidatus Neomarinimicrobiota bacterium]
MMYSDEGGPALGIHANAGWEYQKANFQLLPIRHKTKEPTGQGVGFTKPDYRFEPGGLCGSEGLGIIHARSGTMALDIDNWKESTDSLHLLGIDLEGLYNAPAAVTINSGVQNRGKLLYRMPKGLILPRKTLKDSNNKDMLDFRCGGCYDVLPPSTHPSGESYKWGGLGSWKRLPAIPIELLDYWKELVRDKRELVLTDRARKTSQTVNYEDIDNALYYIPADCARDEWIRVGMALHSIGDGSYAFGIWDVWSSKGEGKYPGRGELIRQWNSFKTFKDSTPLKNRRFDGVITLGTLFYIAKSYGYTPPQHLFDHLFKEIDRSTSTYSDGLFEDELSLFDEESLFDGDD